MAQKAVRLPDGLDVEAAREVLQDYAETDDPVIVNGSEVETLEAKADEAKRIFAGLVGGEMPQSVDTLQQMEMDALTEPLTDGTVTAASSGAVDTLRQQPETGAVDDGTDSASAGGEFDPDALSYGDRQELETLETKRRTFLARGIEGRAEEIEAEMADVAGVDSYAAIDVEW